MIQVIIPIILSLILGIAEIHWGDKNYAFIIENFSGLVLIVIVISYVIYKRVHWAPAITYFYFSMVSLIMANFPLHFWRAFESQVIVTLQGLVFESLLFMTLITVFFLFIRRKIFNGFIILGLIDSVVILLKMIFHKGDYFVFNNPAIDCAFIACCLPGIINLVRKINSLPVYGILLIPLSVLFLSKTSSGVLGVGVSLSMYLWASNRFKKSLLIGGIALALLVAFVGYKMQGEQILNTSGRVGVWTLAMKYWQTDVNHFIGAGLGTFFIHGPSIQMRDALAHGYQNVRDGFFWMHNDPLQILFEGGIIGLVMALMVFIIAVFKARKNPVLFSTMLTFFSISFIQMPLRWIIFASFGACMFIEAFNTSKEDYSNT